MSKIGNIIQRVQSLYSKGVESDDSRLMRRHIYDKMLSVRSLLIFNKVNKKQFLSKFMYTYLPCVQLKLVEGNDCPCIPAPGCRILRTVHKLPRPINSKTGYILDSVMSINGAIIFHEVTHKSKLWREHDKYTSAKPDFFIKDDYLYITSTRKLKAISILGLFVDPIEAENFPSFCNKEVDNICPSNPMDIEFPIDEEMVDALIEVVLSELTAGFRLGNEDYRNNSRDDNDEQPQQKQSQQKQSRQPRE